MRLSGPVPIAGPAAAPFVVGFASLTLPLGSPPHRPAGVKIRGSRYSADRHVVKECVEVSTLPTFLAISSIPAPLAPIRRGPHNFEGVPIGAIGEFGFGIFRRRRATPIDSSFSEKKIAARRISSARDPRAVRVRVDALPASSSICSPVSRRWCGEGPTSTSRGPQPHCFAAADIRDQLQRQIVPPEI